ncbi:MAG: metal ABC transporter substrate-binding protein [Clostridiales bacterium]|nr:metal ABC transporter substrate-binding protein [Clostridiales bacterium]
MKRRNTFYIALVLLVLLTAAMPSCSSAPELKDGRVSIVCTTFPQFDWTRQILGNQVGNVDLTFLLSNNIDLHNYQPSVDDMVKISSCDLFIYVGGESDKWAADAIREVANPGMAAISLLDRLGAAAKLEENAEGMEDDEDEEEAGYDEHVWLSLRNAAVLCGAIADALVSLDPGNAEEYRGNLAEYTQKLMSLDVEYQAFVDASSVKTLLFGDRFPFRYLMDDYGLSYYAAFPGCSAETEASFNTVVFLAEKIDELDLGIVMVTESADQSIARTIVSNTKRKDQQILVLDSMQSTTDGDVRDGATYLSIMKGNLDALEKALE